jgi:hypothetical protein
MKTCNMPITAHNPQSGNLRAPLRGALKTQGAAAYLSLSPLCVRRLVKRGLIRPNRATRHLLFAVAELDRFLRDGQ